MKTFIVDPFATEEEDAKQIAKISKAFNKEVAGMSDTRLGEELDRLESRKDYKWKTFEIKGAPFSTLTVEQAMEVFFDAETKDELEEWPSWRDARILDDETREIKNSPEIGFIYQEKLVKALQENAIDQFIDEQLAKVGRKASKEAKTSLVESVENMLSYDHHDYNMEMVLESIADLIPVIAQF